MKSGGNTSVLPTTTLAFPRLFVPRAAKRRAARSFLALLTF
jgi:hypothetical protein